MSDDAIAKIDRLNARIERSEATLAAFARMAEELKAIRREIPEGEGRERIDAMLKLNYETFCAVRKGLLIAEEDLGRSERTLPEQSS